MVLGPLVAGGCLAPQDAQLYVFSTHHATPVDGQIPERGKDMAPRIFPTDVGWTVTLVDSYITITALSITDCAGSTTDLEMFWGPCPENLLLGDLDPLTVAGAKIAPGDYCELAVTYGPYETPEELANRHDVPSDPEVAGTSIYLKGGARQDADSPLVPFTLRTSDPLTVKLDLQTLNDGAPFNVGQREEFSKELTLSKTYDRYFDGIDFAALDTDAAQDQLVDVLAATTRVQEGTLVLPNVDATSETGTTHDGGAP